MMAPKCPLKEGHMDIPGVPCSRSTAIYCRDKSRIKPRLFSACTSIVGLGWDVGGDAGLGAQL